MRISSFQPNELRAQNTSRGRKTSCVIVYYHETVHRHCITFIVVNHDSFLTENAEISLGPVDWLTFSGYADNGLVSLPPSNTLTHNFN